MRLSQFFTVQLNICLFLYIDPRLKILTVLKLLAFDEYKENSILEMNFGTVQSRSEKKIERMIIDASLPI